MASTVGAGALGSLGAGLATGIGALPILGRGRIIDWNEGALLGFAAGVMLAASFFSLIIPALDAAQAQGMGSWARSATVTGAILVGAGGIGLLGRFAPHIDAPPTAATGGGGIGHNSGHRATWLLVVAITLHNIPEGAAVALSFAGGDTNAGLAAATGIGVQNIPEGLAVAGSLATMGYNPRMAALGGFASGLVEPVAGLISALLVTWVTMLLPIGLALAAGAMISIVAVQLLPEIACREDCRHWQRYFFGGLAMMLLLDTALA